ncbi:MAG: choice-of-anchor A family protein, partial [Kiritimatiellae bacterium]|nr:choice-of-anchor A family protein [Kiritimatiellia bacterium]
NLWSSSYYTPVSTSTSSAGTTVWLYNPTASSMTVQCQTRTGTGGNTLTTTALTVPGGTNGGYLKQVIPNGYGARFYNTSGVQFYAMSSTDSTSSSSSGNRTWDWGFALVPQSSLTPQVLIGLGIGRDPTSSTNPNENGNPVWVTPVGNGNTTTTIYIDYDANPLTGALTDPNGNKYDTSISLRELDVGKIYDSTDRNQTGMLVYTLTPGVKLAAAWGQDPLTASASAPGLDVGTAIPPLPLFDAGKNGTLQTDNDGDGFLSPGDTMRYTIVFNNISRLPVPDILLTDNLPVDVTYVPNSTTFKNHQGVTTAVADDTTGSPFPFDESGKIVNPAVALPVRGTFEVSFLVAIKGYGDLTPGLSDIVNNGVSVGVGSTIYLTDTTPLNGRIGDYVWNDLDGDGVQDAGEPGLAGATVELYQDSNGNGVIDAEDLLVGTRVTGANGQYLFTGVTAGSYLVSVAADSLPAGYELTTNNDPLPVTLVGGQVFMDADFGYQDRSAGTVNGHLYLDTNGNGVQDAGEPNLPNVNVVVTDANNQSQTVVTDANGNWTATVPPGAATADVDETDPDYPAGYTQTEGTDPSAVTAVTGQNTFAGNDGYFLPILGIELTKTASPQTYSTVGQVITYAFTVKNTSNVTLTNVVVTDPTAVISGGPIAELAPSASDSTTFTATRAITQADLDAGLVYNIATTEGTAPGGTKVNDTDDETVTAVATPGIELTKVATPQTYAAAGDVIVYTFNVKNTGNVTLTNVSVSDTRLNLNGLAVTPATLAPNQTGTATANYTVTQTDVAAGRIDNTATAKGTPPQGPAVVDSDDETATALRGTVGGHLYIDTNGNGAQDAGEPNLPNVNVVVTDSNGQPQTVVTDANGNWLATVPPGATTADVDETDPDYPAGYTQTEGDDPTSVTAVAGVGISAGNDGYFPPVPGIELTKTGVVEMGAQDPWATCNPFGPAQAFNALIFGDFTSSAGDTDGRLAVGGDANIPVGYSVGFGVYGHAIPPNFGGTTDMFIVGGDLTDGAWGVNGNIVYGGTRTGPVRWMNDGNLVRHVTPVTFRRDGNVPSNGSGASFEELRDRLDERSDRLAELADRGVVLVDSTVHSLYLVGNDPVLNVFNLDASDWNGSSRGIFIDAPEGSTVLINVHGPQIEIRNSSMDVSGTTMEHVLVHYVDATQVSTTSFTHAASVLAMHADGSFLGGSIDGRAVFGGSVTSGNGFEFHNYDFLGHMCNGENPGPVSPQIRYTFTVKNTGNVNLVNVNVVDDLVQVTGGPISLAPGETSTTDFTAVLLLTDDHFAMGALTNVAHAVGYTLGGQSVTDTATHVADLPDPEIEDTPAPVVIPPDSGEQPDLQIQSVDLVPSPTIVGTRFTARVRIANLGLSAASNVSVNLWSGAPAYSATPEGDATASKTVDVIPSGESVVVEFTDLIASLNTGTYHAMAVVNPSRSISEQSYGNNHGGTTYSLEKLTVKIEPANGAVKISWNSVPGYIYCVERSNGLSQPFAIIAEDIPSTPPVNTYEDSAAGGTFFYRVWGYKP